MKIILILLYLLINIADAEVISKKAILNILESGAKKKMIAPVVKTNYKNNKEDKNLPLGNLPSLPPSSIELSNRYNKSEIKQKKFFTKVVTQKKIIPSGTYAKQIKFK